MSEQIPESVMQEARVLLMRLHGSSELGERTAILARALLDRDKRAEANAEGREPVACDVCPDCGREKATSAADAAKGLCPKWWAITDGEAEKDCRNHASQPSGPVEVKPLVWEERVGVDGTFDAYTSIGHYIATITDDDRGMWFVVGLTRSNYCAPEIEVVKAAAQADYERRILSALTASKPEQAVPSGWVAVPQSALNWLFGTAPDADGNWFGDTARETKGRYWWRSHFRRLISPAAPMAGGGDA